VLHHLICERGILDLQAAEMNRSGPEAVRYNPGEHWLWHVFDVQVHILRDYIAYNQPVG